MARFSLVAVVLLVSGCHDVPPDRSRLAEGQMASVFIPNSTVVRVRTMMGDGLADQDFDFVGTGTEVMVAEDAGDESKPGRTVRAVVREGEKKGLLIRVERDHLRPR
jgi:hypothetical protein